MHARRLVPALMFVLAAGCDDERSDPGAGGADLSATGGSSSAGGGAGGPANEDAAAPVDALCDASDDVRIAFQAEEGDDGAWTELEQFADADRDSFFLDGHCRYWTSFPPDAASERAVSLYVGSLTSDESDRLASATLDENFAFGTFVAGLTGAAATGPIRVAAVAQETPPWRTALAWPLATPVAAFLDDPYRTTGTLVTDPDDAAALRALWAQAQALTSDYEIAVEGGYVVAMHDELPFAAGTRGTWEAP